MLISLLELDPEDSRFNDDNDDTHAIKAAKLYLVIIIPEIICFGYSAYFCIFKRACRPGWRQFLYLLVPGLRFLNSYKLWKFLIFAFRIGLVLNLTHFKFTYSLYKL